MYDVGVENGIYYIVMELVEGVTLKKYIEKRGKLPYKEAVSIAIQVANVWMQLINIILSIGILSHRI